MTHSLLLFTIGVFSILTISAVVAGLIAPALPTHIWSVQVGVNPIYYDDGIMICINLNEGMFCNISYCTCVLRVYMV